MNKELELEYNKLKYKRDMSIMNNFLASALGFQLQIIAFYKKLSFMVRDKEILEDHIKISEILFYEKLSQKNHSVLNYLYHEAWFIHNNICKKANTDNIILSENEFEFVVIIHMEVLSYLRLGQMLDDYEIYWDRLKNIYKYVRDRKRDDYYKIYLHYIKTLLMKYEPESALKHYDLCKQELIKYIPSYYLRGSLLLYFIDYYISIESYDDANIYLNEIDIFISKWEKQEKDSEVIQLMKGERDLKRICLLYAYNRYNDSLVLCLQIENQIVDDELYFRLILLIVLNYRYLFQYKKGIEYCEKAIKFYQLHKITNQIAYYNILNIYAAMLYYFSGKSKKALSINNEALIGYEQLYGKDNYYYLDTLIDYYIFSSEAAVEQLVIKTFKNIDISKVNPDVMAKYILSLTEHNVDKNGKNLDNEQIKEIQLKESLSYAKIYNKDILCWPIQLSILESLLLQKNRYDSTKKEIKKLFLCLKEKITDKGIVYECLFAYCKIIYYCLYSNPETAFKVLNQINVSDILETSLIHTYFRMVLNVYLFNNKINEIYDILKRLYNEIFLTVSNNIEELICLSNYIISLMIQYFEDNKDNNDLLYKYLAINKYLKTKHNKYDGLDSELIREIKALEIRKIKNVLIDTTEAELDLRLANLYKRLYQGYEESAIEYRYNEIVSIPFNSIVIDIFTPIIISHEEFGNITSFNSSFQFIVYLHYEKDGERISKKIYSESINNLKLFIDLNDKIWSKHFNKFSNEDLNILKSMYHLIFKQVQQDIDNCDILYVIPDSIMYNIPVDLFINEDNEYIVQHTNILFLQCIQDLKLDFMVSLDSALLMGNPSYNLDNDHIQKQKDLNFAESEVILIGELLNTAAYVGEEVNKKKLLEDLDYSIIHISSHGNLDDYVDDLITTSTGSYVLLAGIEDFERGKKKDGYGNGLLSAEELMDFNLMNTELVILSACITGQGYITDLNIFNGIRWAISHTGARASITTLWEVNDAATAVFMILFYQNIKRYPLGKALQKTKLKMMNLTAEELYSDDILKKLPFEKKWLKSMKPFENPIYWGAFICYIY